MTDTPAAHSGNEVVAGGTAAPSAQSLGILALSMSFLLGGIVSGALLSPHMTGKSDLYLSWVLATWGGAVIIMQAHRHATTLLRESLPGFTARAASRRDDVQKLVDETWQPYVRQLTKRDNVCIVAADMIKRAHKEADYSDRFLFFQGAASLSTSSKREEEWGVFEVDEDTVTPYQRYSGAIDDAVSDNVRMRRFINVPTIEELGDRSSFLIRDYLDWHAKEFHRLKRNENYIITDSPRAPEWRSGISAILTRRAILFIVGKGEAGLLVQDDRIAEVMRTALNESLLDAEIRATYGEPGPSRRESVANFRMQGERLRAIRGED